MGYPWHELQRLHWKLRRHSWLGYWLCAVGIHGWDKTTAVYNAQGKIRYARVCKFCDVYKAK